MPANRHAHELCVVHDPIRSNYAAWVVECRLLSKGWGQWHEDSPLYGYGIRTPGTFFDCCIGAVRAWGRGFAEERILCHVRKDRRSWRQIRWVIRGEGQLLIGWRSCSLICFCRWFRAAQHFEALLPSRLNLADTQPSSRRLSTRTRLILTGNHSRGYAAALGNSWLASIRLLFSMIDTQIPSLNLYASLVESVRGFEHSLSLLHSDSCVAVESARSYPASGHI